MIARTIAHYRIQEKIGAGGMGEVYRATDSRLGRDVALKVLPEAFARDAERMARFEREAKVLASLNHPNIASIYGLEESNSARALVMELVEGQTLSERIRQGPLPLDEALSIAKQIAEGLEFAHERGIIHRDLKPSNVKVTPDGAVKVLDFGLAKALEGETTEEELQNSPTLSAAATRAGVLLGTAAYMSPEQARGKRVDRRADIWAFGCVIYEMLTGRDAFSGETTSDILACVIRAEPDWSQLPTATPQAVRHLLRRCLQKDPKQRLRDIGDARIAIEEVLSGSAAAETAAGLAAAPPHWRRVILGAIAGLILGGLITAAVLLTRSSRMQSLAPVRLSIPLPAGQLFDNGQPNLAISPDGMEIAYCARNASGAYQIYLRNLDESVAKPVEGTEDGASPFFSPDGKSLGFSTSNGKLDKVSASGGPPQVLCSSVGDGGGAWAADDAIYFSGATHNLGLTARSGYGLMRVPGSGGECQQVLMPDGKKGELFLQHPQTLPGGRALLFTAANGFGTEQSSIAVLSLKTGKRETLLQNAVRASYVSPGYIVFSRSGKIWTVPFDLQNLKLAGTPVPLIEGVASNTSDKSGQFAVSQSGVLVYAPGAGAESERQVVEVDRKGQVHPLTQSLRAYEDLDLSPDGHHLAFTIEGPQWNVWTYDIQRGTLSRLSFENDNRDPFWTADGKKIVYSSLRNGQWELDMKAADGSGTEQKLHSSGSWEFATSFSPDGQNMAFTLSNAATGLDIWILPLETAGKPYVFLQTPFMEYFGQFSPDGHWIAYESNESGRSEVYVQPFPGPGGKWQISNEGGERAVWPRNDNEIFYRNGKKLMAVPVLTTPAFSAGTPHELFEGDFFSSGHYYDASPDGQHFFFIKEMSQASGTAQINVVLNFPSELERRMRGNPQP
jgi:eukaryotic-like serine/threonine-protein kinase